MKKLFILCLISLNVFAGGVMSIKGDISVCDKMMCKIVVGPQLYKIDLLVLTKEQNALLQNKKRGDMISINVPVRAIKEVTDIK